MRNVTRKAWVFISAGEMRVYKGNDGYDDNIVTSYDYDGFVPNYKRVQSGDIVFLSNKSSIVGVGLIENIEEWWGSRNFNRCLRCDSSKIQSRVQKTPRYRCNVCLGEFDEPRVESRECSKFRAHYGRTFTGVNRPLFEQSKYVNRGTQQAMRELHIAEAEKALDRWGIDLSSGARVEPVSNVESSYQEQGPVNSPVNDGGYRGPDAGVINPESELPGLSGVVIGAGSGSSVVQDSGMATEGTSASESTGPDPETTTSATAASSPTDPPEDRTTPAMDTASTSGNRIAAFFRRLWELISGGGSQRGPGV